MGALMADLEDLRRRISLVDVAQQSTSLRRSGGEYAGKCPFHDDGTASLTVNDQFFCCHASSCNASGDLFGWIERIHLCDFKEAVEIVQAMVGLLPTPVPNGNGSKPTQAPPKPRSPLDP